MTRWSECSILDKAFHKGSRLHSRTQQVVSIQHEYHTYGKEWDIFDFKENKTHKDKILIHKRPDRPMEVEFGYFPIYNMWTTVLNRPKHGKVFREFRGKLMNAKVDYDGNIESIK